MAASTFRRQLHATPYLLPRYTLYPDGYVSSSPESVWYGGVLAGVVYVSVVMSLRPLGEKEV